MSLPTHIHRCLVTGDISLVGTDIKMSVLKVLPGQSVVGARLYQGWVTARIIYDTNTLDMVTKIALW